VNNKTNTLQNTQSVNKDALNAKYIHNTYFKIDLRQTTKMTYSHINSNNNSNKFYI